MFLLTIKTEFVSKCRHRNKFLLRNIKWYYIIVKWNIFENLLFNKILNIWFYLLLRQSWFPNVDIQTSFYWAILNKRCYIIVKRNIFENLLFNKILNIWFYLLLRQSWFLNVDIETSFYWRTLNKRCYITVKRNTFMRSKNH